MAIELLPQALIDLLTKRGYRVERRTGVFTPGASGDWVSSHWLTKMLDIQPEDLPLYLASPKLTAEHMHYNAGDLESYHWHEVHMVPFLRNLLELHQEGLWPPTT
jgi:hypothetical protein